jgi:aspartate/glutamate racemase
MQNRLTNRLNDKDYVSILNYYNMNIPKSKKLIKQKAEKIMAEKLCKCIKKLDNKYEAKSIGICTKTIFNRKGYIRGQFQCKKNQSVKIRKNRKNRTRKNK